MGRIISSTLEDYLEAIFRIENEKRVARVKDIAAAVEVAKSTVCSALRSLAEKELVNYTPYEVITLTAEGREVAGEIALRHRIVTDFLRDVLGVAPERADSIACGMEHSLDREVLRRFVCFLAFLKQQSRGERWLEEFQNFVADGTEGESCEECVRRYMEALEAEGD